MTTLAPENPDLAPRVSLADTVSQTMTLAWRATVKMRRSMEVMFDVTIQPLIFTAMFAYIFGGAISGDVSSYLPLIIPGLIGQTVLTACVATGVQLRTDLDDVATAASVVRRLLGEEPVTTPESGGLHVPLTHADLAADVLIALRQSGVSIASVSVQKPSLDEVFLALTGHGTDDATGADSAPHAELTLEVTR